MRGLLPGYIAQTALVASALIAVLSVGSLVVAPAIFKSSADMYIVPNTGHVIIGNTFKVNVVVDAQVPVNVFTGEVRFDSNNLQVESIDYNTSIANLWAELPWYENGAGTINFTGGTTERGGFQGNGSLITVTFRTLERGNTSLRLEKARILAHDGLGTDVPLTRPLDAIFEVEERVRTATVAQPGVTTSSLTVISNPPSTDLNGDGRQTLADVSIFMLNMFRYNPRFDFNQDGVVDTKDLSILMSAK